MHYFLGFPPYRTGGMTKFVIDLMCEQENDKNVVMALWPGQIKLIDSQTSIKKRAQVLGIENYELINPLPVSLDEGIQDVDAYTKSCDRGVYRNFLKEIQPDIIHIHTFMGLHRELIDAAVDLHIRTVFTSHDYFGICPMVTLYKNNKVCNNDQGCKDCIQCNCTALSLNKIKLMQSPLYRLIKDSIFVKKFRKKHRAAFFWNEKNPEMPIVDVRHVSQQYSRLRAYYIGMLESIDFIHFNSSVTANVYRKYATPKASKVISITHRDIADNRNLNTWKMGNQLKITCLAPAKPFKGYFILKETLDNLWNEGKRDFELQLFGSVTNPSPYMRVRKEGFTVDELGLIMAETDVLVAPSVWYETFGFTVLEAISYGVPVIVSDHVGAKDIVGKGGIIVRAEDKTQLRQAIESLTSEKLIEFRKNIASSVPIKLWRTFVDEMYQIY